MVKNSSQNGHALLVIIIIALVVVAALGFVFWNSLNTNNDQSQDTSHEVAKKSEILELDGPMNKYVNYELGFEFLFPKEIYSAAECITSDSVNDNFGNQEPAETHYIALEGTVPMTVLESNDRFIITPKDLIVLSDEKEIAGGHKVNMSCNKQPATVSLIDSDSGDVVANTPNVREFDVTKAADTSEITQYIRQKISDPAATIQQVGQAESGRQEFNYTYSAEYIAQHPFGGGGYKIWYYAERQLLSYFLMGQSSAFQYSDGSNNYYDQEVIDSFKLVN
jgi:hypothetical protein